jgi:hypothetical protein
VGGAGGDARSAGTLQQGGGAASVLLAALGGGGGNTEGGLGGAGGAALASLTQATPAGLPLGGSLDATLSAQGGAGGYSVGHAGDPEGFPSGAPGLGGDASSVAALMLLRPVAASGGGVFTVNGSAYGGGEGGSARAVTDLTAYGQVTSRASAYGAQAYWRGEIVPGTATASAIARSDRGALASAFAAGGFSLFYSAAAGASALAPVQGNAAAGALLASANAAAVGGSGSVLASSSALDLASGASVSSSVTAPVGGSFWTGVDSQAAIGAPAFGAAPDGQPWNSSYALLLPQRAVSATALAGAPVVAAAFAGGQVLGVGAQSGFTALDSSVSFTLPAVASQHLLVGFTDAGQWFPDSAFHLLELRISNGGSLLYLRSWTTLSEALLFFDDNWVDLGAIGAGTLDLLMTTRLDGNFRFSYVFGTGPGASVVPEADSWLMLVLGLVLMGTMAARRGGPRSA